MKRSTILLTALGVLLYLGAVPLFAQGHGGGGGHGAGATVSHGPSTTPRGNKKDIAGGGKSTETSSKTQLNEVINSNPPTKLAQKLMNLLGVTSLSGPPNTMFKSLGRLVSAAHVYKNLDIASSTACQQGLPAGTTCWSKFASAVQNKSLGAAIKQFDPAADPKTETRNATKQANQDVKESESGS